MTVVANIIVKTVLMVVVEATAVKTNMVPVPTVVVVAVAAVAMMR